MGTNDAHDWSGKFGYEILDHNQYLPYIFHGDEKFCATKVFQWHIDQLNIKLNPALAEFPYLTGREMNRNDAILYNEINNWHNNNLYGCIFYTSDTLVRLPDVCDIFKFVQDCDKKTKLGEKYEMDAGLIQIQCKASADIDDDSLYTIWPYISKDKKRYVPIRFLANSSSDTALSATIVLNGIDMMYLRYLYTVLKCVISKGDLQIPCVELDDALTQMLSANQDIYGFDENYWPTKKRQPPKTTPLSTVLGSHIKKLNNNNLAFFSRASTPTPAPAETNTQTPAQTRAKTSVKPVENVSDVMTTTTVTPAADVTSTEKVKNTTKDVNTEEKNRKISSRKRQAERESTHKEKSSKKTVASEHFFEVEDLIDFKMVKGKEMVLVRWKGYEPADDTWEPVNNMNDGLQDDVTELREKYLQKTGRNTKHYH